MRVSNLRIEKSHYEMLSAWRYALRRFERFSKDAARAAGLTPQQHQSLLAIKGFRDREHASVGEIADRLQLKHHSAVGLIDRLVRRKLVRRTASKTDKRRVDVQLTAQGNALISKLSAAHLEELRQLGPQLRVLLESMTGNEDGRAIRGG